MGDRLDPDVLDVDPFEVDVQAAHLFKHPHLGIHEVVDVWQSDPLFYPAAGPLPTDRLLRGHVGPCLDLPKGP